MSDARVSAGQYAPGEAPRIRPEDIEKLVVSERYITEDTLTVCILTLQNGTKVVGESACVYPENYNSEIGCGIARKKAIDKVWALEGYVLANSREAAAKFAAGQ